MNPDTRLDEQRQRLDQHRRDIEALDRRILHLVRERLELARQIGELKRLCRIPLRNFQVEAQVNQRLASAGEDLGLDPSVGLDLAHFLISKAVEEQATLLDADYRGDELEALVIGGKGGMGRWISGFLAGQGHRVRIYDPSPASTPFAEVDDLTGAAASADLVMVAVPMGSCGDVLNHLAELGINAVVAEMCSLKAHLSATFDACRDRGLRLVSFHPMFGPDVRMLSGRTIVFCTDGNAEDVHFVHGFFVNTSADLVTMSVVEHDRRMAVVLGMTHLANLAFARALELSGVDASDLAEVAGVTFARQLETTFKVSGENPELYFQIQALNPSNEDTAAWLTRAVRDFAVSARTGDADGFEGLMVSSHEFLVGNGR